MRRISWLAVSTVMPNMRWCQNLVVAAHANVAAAELILEPPIEAHVQNLTAFDRDFRRHLTIGGPA